tara:strand:+ start:1590 stop:2483 length:894 start_codon:yes stop_codon:yes gene_type:complete
MKKSPFKQLDVATSLLGSSSSVGTPEMMAISAGVSLLSGLVGRRRRRKQQREAKARYDEMKSAYEGLDTSNIYANVQNPYAGMENVMEDLRVNTQQADFMAQQQAQSRADILSSFRGAAGGSGIAALAQSLANQQTQAAAQASASIGQQEAANQRARVAEASRLQTLEREGEFKAQGLRLAGAEQARALQAQKTSTMFGMEQQRLAAANQAVRQGQAQMASGLGGLAAGFAMGQFGNLFGNNTVAPMPASTNVNSLGSGDINFTPTGELRTTGTTDFSFGFEKKIIGFDANGQPIYG